MARRLQLVIGLVLMTAANPARAQEPTEYPKPPKAAATGVPAA